MEKLGTYELTGHLSSQNSGYSVWGFGKKNGKDFFIKQFLSPKYPENDTVSSPARIEKIKKKCQRFEQRKAAIYKSINENSDGNAVRVEEFFRIESKYYISMRKIDALPWTVQTVAGLPEEEKRFLCAVIAHGVGGLHQGGVVHADLKHDNILFMKLPTGRVTAKVIDFDSGFLESDPPADGEEIVGDQVYFSPEACMTFMGQSPELTCKMDIFALGVLFHQYFTGKLPEFDESLGCCPGEAVARGGKVIISPNLPEDVYALFTKMFSPDPKERPAAFDVCATIADIGTVRPVPPPVTYRPPETPSHTPATPNPESQRNFFRPGDL